VAPATERRWAEVGDGVWICRHRDLDLTTGVVIGADAMLVIDTGVDVATGIALREASRLLTPAAAELPLSVAYTHAHYDHCFGTAGFVEAGRGRVPVHAQRGCRLDLEQTGERQREAVLARYRGAGREAEAEAIAAVRPVLPDRVFTTSATVELGGGRDVSLLHLGRGHTDHDVLVLVPDADVLFAGDLLENGAPPAFEDSFPAEWPVTLTRLLDLLGPAAPDTVVVPGHGDPVDAAFVAAQRDEVQAVVEACRSGQLDDGPYPPPVMAQAAAAYAKNPAGRTR
jgi:glyoxylase-like metal-dependent hydrolase (beta-lactamase superfamily II)